MHPFLQVYTRVMVLGYHQNFVSAQYLLNEFMAFGQILHVLTLIRSGFGLYPSIFPKITTELWPLSVSEFHFGSVF